MPENTQAAIGFQELQNKIEEFDSLMQAGLDEVATGDTETAEEYFSDAAYVLNQIENESLKEELATKYTVDPRDFAQ